MILVIIRIIHDMSFDSSCNWMNRFTLWFMFYVSMTRAKHLCDLAEDQLSLRWLFQFQGVFLKVPKITVIGTVFKLFFGSLHDEFYNFKFLINTIHFNQVLFIRSKYEISPICCSPLCQCRRSWLFFILVTVVEFHGQKELHSMGMWKH